MLIHSKDYELHQEPYHIENKDRTKSIMQKLHDKNILSRLTVSPPEKASKEDLLRVHSPGHVNFIQEFCRKGGGYLDNDTYASSQSYQVALLAAGGAIMAAEKVIQGEKWAYSLSRPPGHHAIRERAMGFCLFNNAAVAVEKIRAEDDKKRFLIFDFDVHYGNGDADIFYDDPEVMYVSIHQDPYTLFPGKGFVEEIGSGPGMGFNLNIPMIPGSNNADYIWILDKILPVVINGFKADLLLVEAGFDAHRDDPLSQINIDEDFYSWVGGYLMGLQGSMAVLLEGGYNLSALAQSNTVFINSLLDHKLLPLGEYKTQKEIETRYLNKDKVSINTLETFKEIKDTFSPFWGL